VSGREWLAAGRLFSMVSVVSGREWSGPSGIWVLRGDGRGWEWSVWGTAVGEASSRSAAAAAQGGGSSQPGFRTLRVRAIVFIA